MSALTEDQVAAVFKVLRDAALSREQREEARAWGAGSSIQSNDWSFDLASVDTIITANSKHVRQTPEEAFTDAVWLRDGLLSAGGQLHARGFAAAETINGDDLSTVGWIGAVRLEITMD